MKWFHIGFDTIELPGFTLISIELSHSETTHEICMVVLNLVMLIQWDRKVKPVSSESLGETNE